MSVGRVLIAGGGIAGLATAAGLRRAGIACEIVERAAKWAPLGAGIVLSVNAMAVLRELGVAGQIRARGAALARGAVTDERGRRLGGIDFSLLEARFGPTLGVHRAALHDVLLAAAGRIPITLDASIEELEDHPDHVEVRLSNGREDRFDLVVGADGIRSRVRELCFGALPVAYAGYTCWRFVVDSPVPRPELCEMWGRGLRFGVAPVGGERIYGFAVANAPPGAGDPPAGRLERLRARFAAFGGQVPQVLAALPGPEVLIHSDLEEVPSAPWFRGRIVLLGDAAHAMTPNMGQGAAMALEDSAVLVRLLSTRAPLHEALGDFAARREARVRWVQRQSRRIGRVGQLEGALACRLRNAALRCVPARASGAALRRLASQPI